MKFAYLVMAHHRLDVLKMLLKDLDDKRNDIFLHIDKKTGHYDIDDIRKNVHNANLIIVKRKAVFWGDYSQIACVWSLLDEAIKYGFHDYYHLLVGVEFPLKSQDEIHKFFENHKGYEFIGYDKEDHCFLQRVKYFYFWGKYARANKKSDIRRFGWGQVLLAWQKKVGINRIRGQEDYYKKGYANWSITHELGLYILSNSKELKKYKLSYCGDEVIFHTIVYHSPFYEKIFDKDDEYKSVMRITTWENSKNQYHVGDVEKLLNTGMLFARKFDGEDAIEAINRIIELREK